MGVTSEHILPHNLEASCATPAAAISVAAPQILKVNLLKKSKLYIGSVFSEPTTIPIIRYVMSYVC